MLSCIHLLVGITLGSAGGAAPPGPAGGDVMVEEWGFMTRDGDWIGYELGTLFAPENRSDPESREIRVGFARFLAHQQPPTAPPIFLLPGGPGSSYLTRFSEEVPESQRREYIEGLETFREVSDVVLVDQRGFSQTGDVLRGAYELSRDSRGSTALPPDRVSVFTEFTRQVVKEYEERGIDLRGYTVKECAADVRDIAGGLGYEQISLVATSFGSQWSFAILRLYPELVARALLSGVEPLDHGFDMPSHVFAAVQRMWHSVDSDPQFQPYLPEGGMAAVFEWIQDRLDAGPWEIEATDPDTGETRTVVLHATDVPVREPAALLELYHGHPERWTQAVAEGDGEDLRIEANLVGPLIDSSLGVTPARRLRLWTDPATRFLGRDNFASYLATAELWPSPDVGDDFRNPVPCDIPVVFAQGNWDTSTPLENTYEIAPFFPRSRVLVADRGGHGVLEEIEAELPQVWSELQEFLRTGDLDGIPPRVQLAPSRTFALPRFSPPAAGDSLQR